MGFFKEFKQFIQRGNVMDMAVGIIIGGAFTAIVTSLTNDIITPIITLVSGGSGDDLGALNIPITSEVSLNFGSFIGAIINFLIIAFVVFCLVKAVNRLNDAGKKLVGVQEEEAKAAPVCPHCLEEVKEGATRCPHCGGEIVGGAKSK